MRMWMVDPRIMCRKHLLGEHVELHMFIGAIEKGKSIEGFIRNNCFEPTILGRHADLVNEMLYRGYNHKSVIPTCPTYGELVTTWTGTYVDREKSLEDLLTRCPECKKRYEEGK